MYLFRLIRECGAASLSLTLIILNSRKWVIILLAGWTCLSFPEKKQILSKLKTSSYIIILYFESVISRVVKKIESSRRDGKSNRIFSNNFHFPNGSKIELHAFRKASAFIRVDDEMHQLPAYFDNPA